MKQKVVLSDGGGAVDSSIEEKLVFAGPARVDARKFFSGKLNLKLFAYCNIQKPNQGNYN